jgi:hypothetical protein
VGRLWLALAIVVALGGTALAKRDPACTCAAPRVLPAPGSVDVPTNARLWRLPATAAPDQPIASYELTPHTRYEIRDGGTSFTTGAGGDGSAPVEPDLAMVSITLAGSDATGRKPVSILHVASTMDADVAVVQLRFLLRYDGVTAEARGAHVEILVGKQRVTLRAPRWLVNRKRYHGVPKATL